MRQKKIFQNYPVTPEIDPQDPGFDVMINYVSTRVPTSSEPLTYNNYPYLFTWWQEANTTDSWSTYTTNDIWLCVNNTSDHMVWWKCVFDANILTVLDDAGWNINTSRNYFLRSSPNFSTSYTPNSTNDTQIIASVKLTSTVLTASTVDIQVNSGSGFLTIMELSVSGLAATMTQTATFIVPAGASYQLVQSSGTSSIIYLNELPL